LISETKGHILSKQQAKHISVLVHTQPVYFSFGTY